MPARETFGLVPPGSEIGLYLLFAPFALAFAFALRRRLRDSELVAAITASPGGVAGACGRLLRYALLQRRVVQRRRGWPHAAIFYGFLVLLAATTIVAIDWDIARPFGLRILTGTRYLVFEAFADAFGAIFIAGLIAALVWRLARLRATGRDQRGMQMQFVLLICALVYMGLTGFVLEGLRLVIRPVAWGEWSFVGERVAAALAAMGVGPSAQPFYVGLWWSHALVAFSLIASIPYTAFLHAAAAPLNVMAMPGRPRLELTTPFDLRQLLESGDFDVKIGATSLADLDPDARFALQACTNCGRCDGVCPAVATGTALSPRRLVQTLRARLLNGEAARDLLTGGDVTANALWACTTCAACVEACPVLIRPVDYIVPFRRELVARQQVDRRQAALLANLGNSGNPYGLPPGRRDQLATALHERERK